MSNIPGPKAEDNLPTRRRWTSRAIVLVVCLAGFYFLTTLVSNYVVCIGAECLEKRPKTQSGENTYYHFDSEFCFTTAEFLFSSDFAHLRFGSLAARLTHLHYLVLPGLSLYVVPKGNDDGPVLVIDDFQITEQLEFCATGTKLRRSGASDVIERSSANGGRK